MPKFFKGGSTGNQGLREAIASDNKVEGTFGTFVLDLGKLGTVKDLYCDDMGSWNTTEFIVLGWKLMTLDMLLHWESRNLQRALLIHTSSQKIFCAQM